jgi:basic membrane lipoprotein Med (substrate-binding protein (PBP1-ABC) superfamily)
LHDLPSDREVVLVIDPFEDVFTTADDGHETAFLETLARAVSDDGSRTRVVLTLRADFYDRPLLHAGFAPLFLAGVVNVLPMTAAELEAAAVEPARQVDVVIDPALSAELISDTVDRPGALPLLQHTLAELFDRRIDATLSLDVYRALGGIHGALSRRAEEVFTGLTEERQEVARQVFLRLVRLGEGVRDARRRTTVRELTALDVDPVALSDVLMRFDRGRLISFDRDPITGGATVEVAHEALLSEWQRLSAWIATYRVDLRRHDSLAARVEEWEAAGHRSEDLLSGTRLDEYERWSRETELRLTTGERAYLAASVQRRDEELAEEAARESRERRLVRVARMRLAGLVGAATLLVAAVGYGIVAWPGAAPDVVLVYPGSAAGGMYDGIGDGFDDAVARLGLDAQVVVARPDALETRLRRLSGQGVDLIVVGFAWSNPEVERVAMDRPGTRFLAVDYWGELPNVSTPKFAFEEGAFLVGAAAALTSTTGIVGVISDDDSHTGWRAPAGFWAGARAVVPDVEVLVSYLEPPSGYGLIPPVGRAARDLYRNGADVVFYAGSAAPVGLFEAAESESAARGRHLWAIGIDADWYLVLPFIDSVETGGDADLRQHVLTSMITRWDLGISAMLEDHAGGDLAPGERRFGLADGAFEITASGGFVDDIDPVIESLRDRIAGGEIVVPVYPPDRGPPR